MSGDINWGDIAAVAVRSTIGDREILPVEPEDGSSNPIVRWLNDNDLGWLSKAIVKTFSGLKNWLVSGLLDTGKGFNLSAQLGLKYRVEDFIFNFNVNISDEELLGQLHSEWIALASQIGSTVGCAFGWAYGTAEAAAIYYTEARAVEGLLALMQMPIMVLDKRAMVAALKDSTVEGIEEVKALFKSTFRSAVFLAAKAGLSLAFINARKWVKHLERTGRLDWLPESWQGAINRWGSPGSKPWSLSIARENLIDSIPNDWVREFVDSAVEEFRECQIEAGFIFAHSLSAHQQAKDLLGQPETVEIQPDRESDERIVLHGNTQVLKPVITQAMAHYQLIENRDVGQIVGQSVDEAVLQQMPDSTLKLKIVWSPRPRPPFSKRAYVNQANIRGDDLLWHEPEFSIPWVKPTALDWDKIKRASGGIDGFMTGNIRERAYLGFPDKGLAGRAVSIYADTETTGFDMLKQLGELSEAELHSLGMGQRRFNAAIESDAGKNATDYRRERKPLRVYPRYCFVYAYRKKVSDARDESEGRVNLTGRYEQRKHRIDLWTSDEPVGSSDVLKELRDWYTPLRF